MARDTADLAPFGERLRKGASAIRSVSTRARAGDLVYDVNLCEVFEVDEATPAIVGTRSGYRATSLRHGEPAMLGYRNTVTLSQAEAKVARAYYAAQVQVPITDPEEILRRVRALRDEWVKVGRLGDRAAARAAKKLTHALGEAG